MILLVLLLQHYFSASGVAGYYFRDLAILSGASAEFSYVIGWGLFTSFVYFMPLMMVVISKEPLSNYAVSFNAKGAYLYLTAPLILIPITYFAAQLESFQLTYPFLYKPASITQLVVWELIYILQFVALEFFFRGFVLRFTLSLLPLLPAIVLATVPYVLIHWVKPVPEIIASFIGGVFLCYVVVRYKSIVIAIYLHAIVAVSMDMFSLYHRGWFDF